MIVFSLQRAHRRGAAGTETHPSILSPALYLRGTYDLRHFVVQILVPTSHNNSSYISKKTVGCINKKADHRPEALELAERLYSGWAKPTDVHHPNCNPDRLDRLNEYGTGSARLLGLAIVVRGYIHHYLFYSAECAGEASCFLALNTVRGFSS